MRKIVRNCWRRVLEISWKGGDCLVHRNIIYWVPHLDGFWWAGPSSCQPELLGSKRSFIRSLACVTSPSRTGSHTYQTGLVNGLQLSDRSLAKVNAEHSTKVGTHCTPSSPLPTGSSETARQNIWLQQQGAVSLLAVNQCWSHGLSFHSGISWLTLGQRFAEVVIGSCPAGASHPMCSSAESLPLGNCTLFLFPHTMLC